MTPQTNPNPTSCPHRPLRTVLIGTLLESESDPVVRAGLAMARATGARVVVPMGPRTMTGVVLGEAAAADTAYTIRPIKHAVDDHAFVPADVVKLTEWVSEYYLAGPGATLAAALPPS